MLDLPGDARIAQELGAGLGGGGALDDLEGDLTVEVCVASREDLPMPPAPSVVWMWRWGTRGARRARRLRAARIDGA